MNYIIKKKFLLIILCLVRQSLFSNILLKMIELPDSKNTNCLTLKNPKLNGALSADFLTFLSNTFGSNLFIESGTYIGDTSIIASKCMREVITIELDRTLFKRAKNRFRTIPNITIYQGDTIDVLPLILVNNNKKIIFWLDGHFSSGATAKGQFNTPIIQELECIKQARITDAILLIDDIRFFQKPPHNPAGTAYSDYPEINVILNKVLEINPDYKCALLGDVLMCYIPVKNFSISPALYICTVSRIWEPLVMPLVEINELEQSLLILSSQQEKDYLKNLYQHFVSEQNGTYFGLNKYFNYWYALLKRENKEEFKKYLNQAMISGLNDKRIEYFTNLI